MTVLLPLSLKPGSHPEVHCIDRGLERKNKKEKKEKEKEKERRGRYKNECGLWVNLCGIIRADAQNLCLDISPHSCSIGATEEMLPRDLAEQRMIFHVSVGRSFHSVGAKRKKSYEKNSISTVLESLFPV